MFKVQSSDVDQWQRWKQQNMPQYNGAALRAVRARNGVGRPPWVTEHRQLSGKLAELSEEYQFGVGSIEVCSVAEKLQPTLTDLVKIYGSQRAAARAIYMNLSTFQRRLKKAQCVG